MARPLIRPGTALAAAVLTLFVAACGAANVTPSPSLGALVASSVSPSAAASDQPASTDAPTDAPADTATDAPAEATSSPVDPCSLITVDEASAALGGPADPGQVSSNGKYCYFYAHGSTDNSVEIYLTDPIQFLP